MKNRQMRASALIIMLSTFILVLIFPFSDTLELKTRDLRAQIRGGIDVEVPVVILAIDDASFEKINIRWPWPRQILGEAIVRLKDAGAQTIGLDIMLGDGGYNSEEDEALAEAIKYAGNIILPIKRDVREVGPAVIDYFDMPLTLFDNPAQSNGFINLIVDKDNSIRRQLTSDDTLGEPYFSFALSILAAFEKSSISMEDSVVHVGDRPVIAASDKSLFINYTEPGSFPVVPFYQVLEDDFDPQVFKGKIVLVGAFFKESHDLTLTPFEKDSGLYGIEIHANILNTLYSEKFLRDGNRTSELLILLLLTALGAFLFIRMKPNRGLLFAFIISIVYGSLSFLLYGYSGYIIEMFNPILSVFLTWLGAVLYNYLIVEKEKNHVRNTFSRFVSAEVVNDILDSGNNIELGGELREVAIFFSDICGFTSMSERMDPAEVVEMLNEYFTEMTDVVFKYDGTLNKYIGDAIMAIYGAPVTMENASEKALRASLEMREKLRLFNENRKKNGKTPVNMGMGLHWGKVLVGNIGSPRQMEYTVIGDAVNVCSRIEGLTRDFDTDLLISDALYNEVKDLVDVETLEPVDVKGKSRKIIVHKVSGLKG